VRRAQLVIMLKQPRAGQVKTRLGRDIGMTAAAWWFRHQIRRLLREMNDPRWQITLSVAPDTTATNPAPWPQHLPIIPQGRGDLGTRMARILHTNPARLPAGPACIIGGDIPAIRRAHIARAFQRLGNHDAVFGPATDGGFWLVGMKRTTPPPRALFQNVRWSTRHALSDSIATMGHARIAQIDRLQDIDTVNDLGKDLDVAPRA